MTTTIEPVAITAYKCPETGKLYKTKLGAENSAKRVRDQRKRELLATGFDPDQFETQRDYVRLNATSPKHIIELVTEKAEEFWGLVVKKFDYRRVDITDDRLYGHGNCTWISFRNCEVEVDARSSCRLEYIRRKAELDNNRFFSDPSISDLLFNRMGFKGFETGGGCSGRCSDTDSQGYALNMPLKARLEDFPIIHKRYQEWQTHKNEYDRFISRRKQAESFSYLLASSTPEYRKLKELEDYYARCSSIVQDSICGLMNHHESCLIAKWDKINPKVVRDPELWEMFG